MLYVIIVIMLIIISILEAKLNQKEQPKPENTIINLKEKYSKKDYLLTKEELKFYRILKQITNKLRLFPILSSIII